MVLLQTIIKAESQTHFNVNENVANMPEVHSSRHFQHIY